MGYPVFITCFFLSINRKKGLMNNNTNFDTDEDLENSSINRVFSTAPPSPNITSFAPSSYPVPSQKKLIRQDQSAISQPSSPGMVDFSLNQFSKFKNRVIIPAAKWAYSPLAQKNRNYIDQNTYRIEYSVFKGLKSLKAITDEYDLKIYVDTIIKQHDSVQAESPGRIVSQQEFETLIDCATDLIENRAIQPERISQGSSGSYFIYCFDSNGSELIKVGVFKPKDEEPYGPLSPKWTKWLHRTFLPCFFGRSCLIPNLGYISEASAFVLDEQLLSFVVPRTDIVYLRSTSFYYSYWEKSDDITRLPTKIGSLQTYLRGYLEASTWLKMFPFPQDMDEVPENSNIISSLDDNNLDLKFKWSKSSLQQFREELEKLVILDYIMRNTDRALDNWMIKLHWTKKPLDIENLLTPIIRIGAIDSGLSFPWKRPDEWRSFPFGWLFLPISIIGQPFSLKTRKHYLPLLTSKVWWEDTVVKLRKVFEKDVDFKERMWLKQLAVLKGQAFNVVEALKSSHSGPLELARMENILIWDDYMYVPESVDSDILANAIGTNIDEMKLQQNDQYDCYISGKTSELTPLLSTSKTNNETGGTGNNISQSPEHEISGFLYNLNQETNENPSNERQPQTNTRKVVIERLEKVNNKPPVFTWC